MSNQEEDFSQNIDEQLLQNVEDSSSPDVRIKLERIAHAASLSKPQQQQSQSQSQSQSQQVSPQQQQQQQPQQQGTSSAGSSSSTRRSKRNHTDTSNSSASIPDSSAVAAAAAAEYKKQYEQLQQQQQHAQQQHLAGLPHQPQQVQLQHQQQLAHHHHQQHPQYPHDLAGGPAPDDLSEYNIQIPDPIIDSKSKIYPVSENTITADGNLITRPYPEQVFQSRDELNEFITEFARDNGFGVVIAHSNKKAIYYTCELGGRYRHKKNKKVDATKQIDVGDGYMLDPDTKTKKLKCPFAMTASYRKTNNVWTLRTTCNEHNHPQLDPLSNHPMLRKRSDELNVLILELYKLGTKPSHIESKIKEDYPDVLIKREDIYNEIRGYKRKLKKQSNRIGYNSPSRISTAQFKKRMISEQAAVSSRSAATKAEAEAAAAVAAAADANAFLQGAGNEQSSNDYEQYQHHQQQQQQQQQQVSHQQQQEEFQRQFAAAQAQAVAASQHLDESQYQHYQHELNDNDSSTAAAIAAVANANRQHHHYADNADLSMDNIDSRLVGE